MTKAENTKKKERRGKRPPLPYKSWYEADLADELKRLKCKAKYEPVKLKYQLNLNYKPDWVLPNGVILEAKGKLDYETRRKMEAVKKANPKKDIKLIFMKASNTIRKGSKTTYGDWATQNGFDWSEGFVIPELWLK